ncbi:MAG: hypothetical protein COV07_01900 [Candidatus Vogelbacteria bacterium CG10_big_fil_rev_8_21_14_0_10_45_14]|uniref:Dephospho-CoA kinase n=1 Tax=Candidatus Vogelbacteria bacterium CG10_big_fil_rev_8_21_14_0_10_45_14 TaxID=1975042 RepID=A0A2H0RLJ8_9BACT|nr:MAG: hypothetical protein COV07_01900 [Candidatus Vogelbacteria bacterium CG10_big_fil_rev_8_21_14_0_10_45_14]
MIIGVTGTNGSGKDTVAEILQNAGFKRFSLSDEIREELKKRGLQENRETTSKVADELRLQDLGELSKRVLSKIEKGENSVVVSIRTRAEVKVFADRGDFVLIGVDASPELRYERTRGRGRDGDQNSFEYFLEHDIKERGGSADHEQQIDKLLAIADYVIINNDTKQSFTEKINKLIEEILDKRG